MATDTFLTVDEQHIPLGQALGYLQASGKLSTFVRSILRQHVLEQQLQARDDLKISPTTVKQAIFDFQREHELLEPKQFEQWLTQNGKNYEIFDQEITQTIKLEKLITEVTEPKLHKYFINNKLFLDRVVLSRLVVDDQELAEELKSQLEEGARFEQLAREYSLSNDRIVNGMVGVVSRGQLPDAFRAAIDTTSPEDILGPLEIEGKWCLFRVEQFIPASLADEQLKQTLRNDIFEDWLAEKLQSRQVQLHIAA